MSEVRDAYRRWRKQLPDLPAKYALNYAKAERRYREILAEFDPWVFESGAYGTFAYGDKQLCGYTIRVSVGDDDNPIDWGDIEPTEEEREAASSYYISIQVLDTNEDEVYQDGIGGVGVIDLPDYLQRDWEDAAAMALDDYLLKSAEQFARNEDTERAEWAARDTITI